MRTLTINRAGFAELREQFGVGNDKDLATRMEIDPGTVSRVLSGKSAPGPLFIAAVLLTFPVKFERVFDVIDMTEESAVAA